MTVSREQSVKREKTNKMQQSDVSYQLLSQHVSGIIMPTMDVAGSGCGAMRFRI